MANEQDPNDHHNKHSDHHKDDQKKKNDDKVDLKSLQDKYEELKSNPQIKTTQSLFSNYFFEIFYIVAVVISYIISLAHGTTWAFIFIGLGFLIGLFVFSLIKTSTHKMGSYLSKQELVVHIIVAIILLILACIIPAIMMGILVGIPAGFGVRSSIFALKKRAGGDDDHKDHHSK